jgi:hypothetical protein
MRWLLALVFCSTAYGASTSDPSVYIYEGGQALIDLSGMSGTTNMNACDDCISGWSPNFGFDFDFYGTNYTRAKMSTNGCVSFTGLNCNDYTPQPLPYRDQTLYPFWTDLIRNNSSKMLFKSFSDYVVFGWYGMKEYSHPNHRGSNNFEAILWANDSYEYRYGALDIANHDVLIGEQNSSTEHRTYRYYDKSNAYPTWDSWDSTFGGAVLENGGSLYAASFASQCSSSGLFSTSCSNYDAAYLTQQCDANALYSSQCTGYEAAYTAQQCAADASYDVSCSGYWDTVLTSNATDQYTDVVDGDDVTDYYFVDDDDDAVDYTDTTDTNTIVSLGYDDNALGYNEQDFYGYDLDGYDEDDTGQDTVVVMVDSDVFSGDDFGFSGADGVSDLPVIEVVEVVEVDEIEEVFEETFEEVIVEVFEEEVFEEVFEEPIEVVEIIEEVVEIIEEEIFEEPEEIIEVVEVEEVIEKPEEVIEIVEAEEIIEEEIIEEVEEVAAIVEPTASPLDVTGLALNIVAQTSAFATQSSFNSQSTMESQSSFTSSESVDMSFNYGGVGIVSTTQSNFTVDTLDLKSELLQVTEQAASTAVAEINAVYGDTSNVQLAMQEVRREEVQQQEVQQEQQQQQQVIQQVDTGFFDVQTVEQEIITQTASVQMEEAEESEELEATQDLGDSAQQMQFEQDFNDALGAGQSVGQFLSQQAPDFGQFDVAPPSVEEQQTVRRAENAIQTMTSAEIEQAQDSQLEGMQDSGGFDDQSLTILLMGRVEGVEAYNIDLIDQQQWYQSREIYGGNAPVDGNVRALQGQGAQRFQDLVGQQYER